MSIRPTASLVSVLVLATALLGGCGVSTRSTTPPAPPGRYITPDAAAVVSLLQDPPADHSSVARAELDVILAFQEARTPEDIQRIQADGAVSLRLFAAVLGSSVKPEALPATDALLTSVARDAQTVINQAKARWNRPRPWVLDSRIQPCIDKPGNASYPSDRAAQSRLCAVVLGELFPAKKVLLLARADQVGQDRVISGVHFPSDVRAGKELGQAIAARILQSPLFQADLAAARAEMAKTAP